MASQSVTLRSQTLGRIPPPPNDAFQRGYVGPCRPVVLRGLVADWPAMRRWSLDYLKDVFASIPITTIRTEAGRAMMDGERGAVEERMRLGEFIDSLRAGGHDHYMTSPMGELPDGLRRDAPPPPYCAEATWQKGSLWIGAPGTIAPMHRDLADNLHALVSGHKRFTLVAPRQSSLVYRNTFFDTFPNGCRVDIEHPDFTRFPKLRGVDTSVAEIEPGDAIYIPRRWWHHVRTLEVSVSVNFWWASGAQRVIVLAADYVKRIRGISR